ncbi:MAG: NAD(P)/FAD-dependent oxidoreductase, partial [Pseudomonadota bacterium]
RDIRFHRRVTAAHYDDQRGCWRVTTDQGDRVTAPLVIMATGCLSVPQVPDIPGLDDFAGPRYQAGAWPHEPVDFAGQHVGVIGTGSSAIQAIPVIAAQAARLTVFQRTANFSVPAANAPLDPAWVEQFKANYRKHRDHHKRGLGQGFGDLDIEPRPGGPVLERAAGHTVDEIHALLETYWQRGGARFMGVVGDTLLNADANRIVADFVRDKIRAIVDDPVTAEALCPRSHPIGSKRICVDTGYYETFNRSNVTLVDLKQTPIDRITPAGVATTAAHYDLDALVLATGFDAMTGALLRMDIRGGGGQPLATKWQAGPRSYLGLALAGFPNLFTITGPGSPSVLSNVLVSIEQHVDWIAACLEHMRVHGYTHFEALPAAEDAWVDHVNRVASATLFPEGGSWYLGANVPGKPRVFMPYAGGVGAYREHCERVVARGYEGFSFATRARAGAEAGRDQPR